MPDRDPDTPDARLLRSWSANAEAWTRVVREGRIESRRRVTDAAILHALDASGARRILDVGCGEGWLVHRLVRAGRDVVGVDGSAPLVEAAAAGPGRFLHRSYDELVADPAAAGVDYDAVVLNFSLLGEAVVPLLRGLRACLRPGGHLLIQTVHPFTACGEAPYRDGWREETFDAFGVPFAEPMPWFFRTLESWVDAVGEAGYRVDRCLEPGAEDAERPSSLLLTARPAP